LTARHRAPSRRARWRHRPKSASAARQDALTWRELPRFFGNQRKLVAGLVATSTVSGFCQSAILAILAELATALAGHSSFVTTTIGPLHLHVSVDALLTTGLVLALFVIALQGLLSYLPARIASNTQAEMRNDLFVAFSNASWSEVSAGNEGSFQELTTSQVFQATQGIVQATTFVTSAMMLCILLLSALAIGALTTLLVIGVGAVLFFALRPFNKIGARYARHLSATQVAYANGIHDAESLAEEARVFGATEAQARHLDSLNQLVRREFFRTLLLGRLVASTYQNLIIALVIVGLGILQLTGNASHIASLGAVILLLVRASMYGQQAQGNYQLMHQSKSFIDRVYEARDRYWASAPPDGTRILDTIPRIALEHVTYSYTPGVPALHDISFTVEPGEAIGVVGPTGAGKSTLVQTLLGLRSPQSGTYMLDSEPLAAYTALSRAERFAYVPQEPRLLQGTVADNIRFMRNLDQSAIERAARQAHIHKEIITWRNGYDTPISQRAKGVSGGQRQRLCLARALAGNPFMLILDEPTSGLDPQSEALVQQSLIEIRGTVTLFIIAHRFSTLTICDRIMVLRNGRLDAFGHADQLIHTNTFYRDGRALSDGDRLQHSLSLETQAASDTPSPVVSSPRSNG